MKKAWLHRLYRGLPHSVQRILINEKLSGDLKLLRDASASHPKIDTLNSSLSDALERRGRHAEAVRVWHRHLKVFRGKPNPYFQRAHWSLNRGNFGAAQKFLRLCLARDKGYFRETAFFWRAEALFRIGQLDAAEKDLSHVSAEYEELYFLGYRTRSKGDLLADIQLQRGSQ